MDGIDAQTGSEEQEFVRDPSMETATLGRGSAVDEADGHVHGPGCGHSHAEEATPEMAELEANLMEVAYAMQERFGNTPPTPVQEKEFMREWLISKGRSEEEVDAILES